MQLPRQLHQLRRGQAEDRADPRIAALEDNFRPLLRCRVPDADVVLQEVAGEIDLGMGVIEVFRLGASVGNSAAGFDCRGGKSLGNVGSAVSRSAAAVAP
jgi:hypothetical protein